MSKSYGVDVRRKQDKETFIAKVIEHKLNTKKAMKELCPELKPRSLDVKLCSWLKNPEVITMLANEVKKLNLSPDTKKLIVEGRMLKILTDMDTKDSDAIGAGTLMLKANGLIQDNQVNIGVFQNSKLDDIIITLRDKANKVPDVVVEHDDTQAIV